MIRITTISACMALSLSLGACNRAADEQRKADEARAEADNKVIEANREATEKINAAQAEADQKVADAQASFLKMREEYRHDVTQNLVELDKKIAEQEADAKTATGKKKADLDARLPEIRSQREAFNTEYRSLELASALTWDDAKARVDKAYEDLKKLVNK